MLRTHLGCGVWCEFDGAVFILTRERGDGVIVERFELHSSELQALDEFRRRMQKHQRAPISPDPLPSFPLPTETVPPESHW